MRVVCKGERTDKERTDKGFVTGQLLGGILLASYCSGAVEIHSMVFVSTASWAVPRVLLKIIWIH